MRFLILGDENAKCKANFLQSITCCKRVGATYVIFIPLGQVSGVLPFLWFLFIAKVLKAFRIYAHKAGLVWVILLLNMLKSVSNDLRS